MPSDTQTCMYSQYHQAFLYYMPPSTTGHMVGIVGILGIFICTGHQNVPVQILYIHSLTSKVTVQRTSGLRSKEFFFKNSNTTLILAGAFDEIVQELLRILIIALFSIFSLLHYVLKLKKRSKNYFRFAWFQVPENPV